MKRSLATLARSKSPVARIWLLAAAGALACTMMACGNGAPAGPVEGAPGTAPTTATEPGEKMGSVSFALTMQNGMKFDAFSYAITRPSFSRSGKIDVSNSTTVSALIEGIPAASGYSITLQGNSGPPKKGTCSGSATFAVTAGAVTSVPVFLSCHLDATPPPPTGTPVPIPPVAVGVLGLILLAFGTASARRRRERS